MYSKIVRIGNMNDQLLPFMIQHFLDGEFPEILCLENFTLFPVHRNALVEIAMPVKQSYGTEVDITVRSLFEVVASQHAQPSRIDFQDFVQSVLHAEIGYRRPFGIRFLIHIFVESSIDVIHFGDERRIGG